jgi:hypothetical protein
MIDPFILLAPILLLGVVALLGFVGCDGVFGLIELPPVATHFPTAVVNGNSTTSTTSHVCNLPTGIASGDLLLVFFGFYQGPTAIWPADWTQRFSVNVTGEVHFQLYSRIADGTEGATITVTTSTSVASAHTSFRITGQHASSTPESTTDTNGGAPSSTPKPASLSPTWGAEDSLWIAAVCADHGATTNSISAYPASYINGRDDSVHEGAPTDNGVTLGTAYRTRNIATEDPGPFTLADSQQHVVATVAIRPAAA